MAGLRFFAAATLARLANFSAYCICESASFCVLVRVRGGGVRSFSVSISPWLRPRRKGIARGPGLGLLSPRMNAGGAIRSVRDAACGSALLDLLHENHSLESSTMPLSSTKTSPFLTLSMKTLYASGSSLSILTSRFPCGETI